MQHTPIRLADLIRDPQLRAIFGRDESPLAMLVDDEPRPILPTPAIAELVDA